MTNVSDHLPTIVIGKQNIGIKERNKNRFYYKRVHNDDNIDQLKKELAKVKWHEVLDETDANHDYDKFVTVFNDMYNEYIPLKKCTFNKRKDPRSQWLTKGLLKSVNHKNKLYKEYLQYPNLARIQNSKHIEINYTA